MPRKPNIRLGRHLVVNARARIFEYHDAMLLGCQPTMHQCGTCWCHRPRPQNASIRTWHPWHPCSPFQRVRHPNWAAPMQRKNCRGAQWCNGERGTISTIKSPSMALSRRDSEDFFCRLFKRNQVDGGGVSPLFEEVRREITKRQGHRQRLFQ